MFEGLAILLWLIWVIFNIECWVAMLALALAEFSPWSIVPLVCLGIHFGTFCYFNYTKW